MILAQGYLPLPCPVCNRVRLLYVVTDDGNGMQIECEKCGSDRDVVVKEYEKLVSEKLEAEKETQPITMGSPREVEFLRLIMNKHRQARADHLEPKEVKMHPDSLTGVMPTDRVIQILGMRVIFDDSMPVGEVEVVTDPR